MLKNLFVLFTQPDDFKNNPYGLLTNQVSHVALSTLLSVTIVHWISIDWLFLIIGFWLSWEYYQLFFRNAKLKDTLIDLFFECGPIISIMVFETNLNYILISQYIILFILLVYVSFKVK
jgi:hypothetical protein